MSSSSSATARMSLHEKVQKTRRARQWARTGKSPSGGESVSSADTQPSTAVESHATTTNGNGTTSNSNTLSTPASRAAEIATAHKEKIQRARSVSVGRGGGSVVAGNPPSAFGTSSSSKPKPSVVVSRNESSPATTMPSATPPPAASSYGGGTSRASLIERRQRVLERTGASPARTRSRSPPVQRPSPAAAQQKASTPAAVTPPTTSATPASSSTATPYSVKNRSTVFESSSSSSSTPAPSKSTPTTASSSSSSTVTPSSSIKHRSSIFEKAERARQAHHHSASAVESLAPTGTPASTRNGGKASRPSPAAIRMHMNNSSSNSGTKSTPQPQASVLSPTSRRMEVAQKSMNSIGSSSSSKNSTGAAPSASPAASTTNPSSSYLSAKNRTQSSTSSSPSVLSPTSRRMDAAQKSMSSVRSRTSIFEKAEQKRQTNTTTPANSSSSSNSVTSSTTAASPSSTAVAMDPSNQSVKNKKNMFEKNRMTLTKNSSTAAAAAATTNTTTTTPSSISSGGGGVEKDTPNSVKSRSNIFEKEKQQPRTYGQRSPAAAAEVSPKPPAFPPRQEQQQPSQNNGSSTNSGGGSSVAELKNSFQNKLNMTYSDDTNSPKSNPSSPSPTATSKINNSSKRWPTPGTPAAFYSSNNGSNNNTTPADRPLSHRPSSITKEDPPESDVANEEKKDDSPERANGNLPSTIVVPSWKQRSTNNSKTSASPGSGGPFVHQSSWIKNSPTDERMDYAATNQNEEQRQRQQQRSTQPKKKSPPIDARISGSKGGRRSRSVVAAWQAKQARLSSPDSSMEEDQEQQLEQDGDDDYVPDPEDIDHVPSDSPTSSFGTGGCNTNGGVMVVGKERSTVGSSSPPAWLTAQKFPSKSPASDVGVSDQYKLPSLQKKNNHEAATPSSPVTDSSAVASQIAEKVASPARPSWMTENKFPSKSPATSVVKHDAVTPVVSHQSSFVSTARKPVGGLGSSSSNNSPRNNAITTSTTSRGTVEGNITKNRTSKPVKSTAAVVVVTSPTESVISATSSPLWANLAPTSSSSTYHNTNDDTANGDNEDEEVYEEIRTHTNGRRKEQEQQHHHDLSLSMENQSFYDQNRPATTVSTSVISATDSKDMSSFGTPNTSLITMNMNETSLEPLYSPPVKIKTPGFTEDQEEVEMEFKSKSSEVSEPQSQQGGVEYIDGRPDVQMNAQQQQQQQVDDNTTSKSLFEMAADSVLIVDYNQLQGIALQQTDTHDTDAEEEDDEDGVPTTPAQLPKEIQDIMDSKKQSTCKQQQKHERFFNFDDQSDDDDDNHKQKQQQQQKEQQEDEDQTSAASSNKNDNAVFGEDNGDMYAYVTTDTAGAGVAFETSSPERLSNAGRRLANKSRAIPRLAPSHKDTGSYQETGRPSRSSPPKKDKNADSPEPPPPPSGTPPSDDELRLRGTTPPQIPNHMTPTMGTGTAFNHDDLPTGSFPSAPSDEGFSPMSDASIFGPLVGAFPSPRDSPPQEQEQQRSQSQPRPSSRHQTPETTKSILRESKTEKGRRRSVRFSDPPPPLVVDADAPVSAQRTSAEQDNGSGWEKRNDGFESADNFYSSISPKATPKGSDSQSSPTVGQPQTDDPADSYYNSISPRVNTPKDPRNQTYDNPMDEYYGNASPTNAGDADGNNEADAANILKYWATSDDSQNFNDADQWMDQDPDLDGPGFREDSPSPEPVPIMYNRSNKIDANRTTDPSFQSMSQAMASPHPIPPPPPMSPDEAMDVFNPFGTFSCGVSGGFRSSDPFSPISNSRMIDNGKGSMPIQEQGSTASSNSSNGGTDTKNTTSIKLAPSARDARNPTKKRSPPSRSNGRQSSSSSNGSGGQLYNQQQQSYSRSYSGSGDWDTSSDINDDWERRTNNLEI